MGVDLSTDETGDVIIDQDTGDFVMIDDSDQSVATQVALGTNEGELSWNPNFGLNHLNLLSMIDDENAVEAELDDYLTSQFDNFVSCEVNSIDRDEKTRTATIHTTVTYLDDNGDETTADAETEVDDIGSDE